MLDLQAIPAVKESSCLPIISDPSHASFWHKWVKPLSLASLAVGAEGLMIETHPDPRNAAVDPLQAINFDEFSSVFLIVFIPLPITTVLDEELKLLNFIYSDLVVFVVNNNLLEVKAVILDIIL